MVSAKAKLHIVGLIKYVFSGKETSLQQLVLRTVVLLGQILIKKKLIKLT